MTVAPLERVKEICISISPLLSAVSLLFNSCLCQGGLMALVAVKDGHMVNYDRETFISNLLSKL